MSSRRFTRYFEQQDASGKSANPLTQLEAELHVDLVPGTEIMTDVGSVHFVKGRHTEVLVPQPSADPQDPLVRPPLRNNFA